MSQSRAGREGWLKGWKQRVRQLKSETYTLYLAYRDPRVPWYAKAFAASSGRVSNALPPQVVEWSFGQIVG
ncbi:MAG: hypothetical protein ACLFU8_06745 [Anaerolineales bacterium]